MFKNYLLALVAVFALLMAGCTKPQANNPDTNTDNTTDTDPNSNKDDDGNKEDDGDDPEKDPDQEPGKEEAKITSADFVGSWNQGNQTDVYILKEDGTYIENRWGDSFSGQWAFKEEDSTITLAREDSEPWTTKVLLIGGKAWMVFVEESDPSEEYQFHSTESFRKAGVTVQSGPLGDGRWDAPHGGIRPKEYNDDADYSMCFVVSGSNIDLYVPMWGWHIQGTFTLEDGYLKIATDDDHIWVGKQISVSDQYNWYFGWNAWNEEMDCNSMNAETFELVGFNWYTVNELKAMGHAPEDPENPDPSFQTQIWLNAVQIHEDAMELCNFELCVTDDGTEAYGGSVGLNSWFYKR